MQVISKTNFVVKVEKKKSSDNVRFKSVAYGETREHYGQMPF